MNKENSILVNNDTKEKSIENDSEELFDKLNIEGNDYRRISNTIKKEDNDLKITGDDMLLNAIANSFPQEQKLNENLKKKFSRVLLFLLSILIFSIVGIVLFMGTGKLKYNEWTIRLFITGVFIEIVGIIQIIVTSLFPKEDRKNYFDFLDKCTHHKHEKE
ncbi:hypothetical protein [Clostridium botulinum]|uniref:Uncharacterized protein n=1 Tax=Clostridium botulinum (strain 657 / Type Ba4) TaxID=515621 RepID=A0A3F2ZWS1_CLOB6|nr:hypothetical protein [Clostridium botulinum]ACQ55032.1 conserved hypothetical protein [Clostridium botulinum Ba4 str. 657]APR00264.1 hypothetical protein RSJ2_2177 [Clostridium botulinum]AXG90558.1 hypothetical protein AGE29_01720 [Clostridium botulinum]OSA69915.1 hypothetical protein B2H90_00980 [Clostridium botulinum]OSA82610.1 hypothetical protein B2H84_07265 [Clostridium botulinum]